MHTVFKISKINNLKGLLIMCVAFAIMILVGCQNGTEEQIEDLGSYFFGDLNLSETPQLTYEGDWLRIPYLIEGFSEEIQAEFGWFFFVDGLPQATKLETLDGEIFRVESYMHKFSLSYHERHEFYVLFRPISGQIGETIIAVDSALFRPSYMPADLDYPFFGMFHSVMSALPREININHEIQKTYYGNIIMELQPIPQHIIEDEIRWLGEETDIDLSLRQFRRTSIIPADIELQAHYEGIIKAEDGYAHFTFLTYGGEESRRRVTFFVNHEPIQVDGFDYIEVDMEHGQMLMLEISLKLENIDRYNIIYALMATSGEAYDHDIFKSPTLIIINE